MDSSGAGPEDAGFRVRGVGGFGVEGVGDRKVQTNIQLLDDIHWCYSKQDNKYSLPLTLLTNLFPKFQVRSTRRRFWGRALQ